MESLPLIEIKQVAPGAEIRSLASEEEKRDKCPVILTQGNNKGERCNRPVKMGSDLCAAHHISAERKGSKLREKIYESKSEDEYDSESDHEPIYNKGEEHFFKDNKALKDLIDESTKQVDLAIENNTEHLKQVEKVLKLKILESLIDLAKLVL